MPILQSRIGASGGGGGDATAANQVIQIGLETTTSTATTQIVDQLNNAGNPSVFKDQIIFNSVFRDITNNQSLFFKTKENTNALANINAIRGISFTNITAAGVTADLNTWLIANNCFICGLTATQGAGTHDLYLLYSV